VLEINAATWGYTRLSGVVAVGRAGNCPPHKVRKFGGKFYSGQKCWFENSKFGAIKLTF